MPLAEQGALLVLPRIVELDLLFSESGPRAHDGRRLLLRRPSGFDVHSVREYEEGESLRKVHWKSTARRGQLMVKELQDEPRDEVAILLDADARSVAGDSFDAQVRAAGSLLRTQVHPRPPCGAGRELAPAGSGARADRARRVASGARDARIGGTDRPGAARGAPRRRIRPGGSRVRGRAGHVAPRRARSSTGSSTARWPSAASRSCTSTRRRSPAVARPASRVCSGCRPRAFPSPSCGEATT